MKFKCRCGTLVEVSDDKGAASVTCPACGMAAGPVPAAMKIKCRCGKVIELSEDEVGKKVVCPACGAVVTPTVGAIKFRCHCGKVVEVAQSRTGQMYVCPFCRLTMLIPFAHENAPFREEAQSRRVLKRDGEVTTKPLWVNAWLDSAYWPAWVKPVVVVALLIAIAVPVWILVSGSGGSSLPNPPVSPPPNKATISNVGVGSKTNITPPSSPVQPVTQPPKKHVVKPPPPAPEITVYGEGSFNVITGVSGKHFNLEGYTPTPEYKLLAFRGGAVLVVGVPEGVLLRGARFDFRQVVVVEEKSGRVTYRAATPHDKIRLTQGVKILGRDYGPGDFELPEDGKVAQW